MVYAFIIEVLILFSMQFKQSVVIGIYVVIFLCRLIFNKQHKKSPLCNAQGGF